MLIAALSYFIGFWVVRSISHTSNAHFCFSAINETDHFGMGEHYGRQLGMYQLNTSQLPRFTFNGDNRLDFLGGFPDVAAHFGFTALIYGEIQARPGDDGEEKDEWDRLNSLALAKLKFYVSTGVHSIVWKGETLTAHQYYQRLYDMFLAGDMRSRQTLEAAWNNCYRGAGEMLMDWWGRFDGILAELSVIGVLKEDGEKKAKAMFLIGDEYATLAEYLGWREDVTYLQFQQAMLKRDRDIRQYGVARDQRMADATSVRRNNTNTQAPQLEGSFAVTTRQAWRGTGFAPRGRGGRFNNRAGPGRNNGRRVYNNDSRQHRGRNSGRISNSRNSSGRNHTNQNNGTCWRCGQLGHHRRDCTQQAQANLVEGEQQGMGLLEIKGV